MERSADQTKQLLRMLREDLDYLRTEWANETDARTLRHGSTILRRLLQENVLQIAWKAFGYKGEPSIAAPELECNLTEEERDNMLYAAVFGAWLGRIGLATSVKYRQHPDEYPIGIKEVERTYKLSDYFKSPCVWIEGIYATRRDVILYVSNKQGGAHLDFRRKESEVVYRLFDKYRETATRKGDKDFTHLALFAIGQHIASSADIMKLKEEIG